MDRSPNREIIEKIGRIASSTPGVDAVEKCLVRKMGYQYFVDMHVEVDPEKVPVWRSVVTCAGPGLKFILETS